MTSAKPSRSDQGSPDASGARTVLAVPIADRLVIGFGFPAVAVLLGLVLPPIARWVLGLSIGLPMRPVFMVVGRVDRPWEVAINLAIWLAVGLGIAHSAMTEAAKVTLTDAELRLDRDGGTRIVPRADVAAVFTDGKMLVALDNESRQLVRDTHQASDAALASAFRQHGYPWQDADPYADLFRRWAPDTTDLPAAVNAVLAARAMALEKKAGPEAGELRDAVEKLGFVVRDDGNKQYWRPLVRS